MAPVLDLDGLPHEALKALTLELLGRIAELERILAQQRDEIARLKGLKGPPHIKPSGMQEASRPTPPRTGKRRRGRKPAKGIIHEQRTLKAAVPPRGLGHGPAVPDLTVEEARCRLRRNSATTSKLRLRH